MSLNIVWYGTTTTDIFIDYFSFCMWLKAALWDFWSDKRDRLLLTEQLRDGQQSTRNWVGIFIYSLFFTRDMTHKHLWAAVLLLWRSTAAHQFVFVQVRVSPGCVLVWCVMSVCVCVVVLSCITNKHYGTSNDIEGPMCNNWPISYWYFGSLFLYSHNINSYQ